MTYKTQLADPRWKAKRKRILERDEHKCLLCGNTKKLHVHHIEYTGKAWEAPDDDLVTLCAACHKVVHIKNVTIDFGYGFEGMSIQPISPGSIYFDFSTIGATEEDIPYLAINGDNGNYFVVDLRAWGMCEANPPWAKAPWAEARHPELGFTARHGL